MNTSHITSHDTAPDNLKRRRVDEDGSDGATKAELTQDEVVWFEDGNIIVLAGPGCNRESGPIYGFKCHKSVLVAKSPVFETLFQLPNSGGGGDAVDGVQTVDFPDKWEDVRDFLRYLYGALPAPVDTRNPSMPQAIAGPLRLAAKYDCPSVLDQLKSVLEKDWPDDFDKWVLLEEHTFALSQEYQRRMASPYNISWHFPDPAHTVRLAQETRLPGVLRAAWYDLSRCHVSGESRFRGVLDHKDWICFRTADIPVLEPQDLRRLIIAGERMRDFLLHDLLPGIDREVEVRAKSKDHCGMELRGWWKDRTSRQRLKELMQDPLGIFLSVRRELYDNGTLQSSSYPAFEDICLICKFWLSGLLDEHSRTVWVTLPEIFDLESLGWTKPLLEDL